MSVSQSRLLSAGPQSSLTHERRARRYGRVCEPWCSVAGRNGRIATQERGCGGGCGAHCALCCAHACSAAGQCQSSRTLIFPRALLAEMCAEAAGAKVVASEVGDGQPDTRALQALYARLGAAAAPVRQPAQPPRSVQQTAGYRRHATDGMHCRTLPRRLRCVSNCVAHAAPLNTLWQARAHRGCRWSDYLLRL